MKPSHNHIEFWLNFFDLSCLVQATQEWRQYFHKYFDGTSVVIGDKKPSSPYATLVITDRTMKPNRTIFSASYKNLTCTATVFAQDHSAYPMINNCIQRLFTRLIYTREGLVFHASSVLNDKKAHIFVGKSGAGKSTVARISYHNQLRILSDNFVFITKKNNTFVIYPYPFDQFHNRVYEKPIPIGSISLLYKSHTIEKKLVDKRRVFDVMKNQLQIQTAPNGAKSIDLNTLLGLLYSVNIYKLYFTKTDNFWSVNL